METAIVPLSLFGRAIAGDQPRPTIEALAALLLQFEELWDRIGRDSRGRTLAWMVGEYPSALAAMVPVCLAAGQGRDSPLDFEPWIALDALSRVRGLLGRIASDEIERQEDRLIRSGQVLRREAVLALTEPLGAEPDERTASPGFALMAAAGLLAYAMARSELSGLPCLADRAALDLAFFVVVWCLDHAEERAVDSPTVELLAVMDQARKQAAEDVAVSAPNPFDPDPLAIEIFSNSEATQ